MTILLDEGELSFTIESRILRELGERLVRQPEVALVELIKNAYDADATTCIVDFSNPSSIVIDDDGVGMTLDGFVSGWMRVGTSSKANAPLSPKRGRPITGEKGIGRFAVRFLGRRLNLTSTAFDHTRGTKTILKADFDWPKFDVESDLSKATVPWTLQTADGDEPTGTVLTISGLRPSSRRLNLRKIRSESLAVVSPLRSLIAAQRPGDSDDSDDLTTPASESVADTGFQLLLVGPGAYESEDVAAQVLDAFVLRATVDLVDGGIRLRIYRRGVLEPYLEVTDRCEANLGNISADIRFFPRRSGTFAGLSVKGTDAYSWLGEHAGVAVFDRGFRVQPYGSTGDDWLQLQHDAARNHRQPRSKLALKHFPMTEAEYSDTSENWMLRLPQSAQLIGVVEIAGARQTHDGADPEGAEGLIAAADREGFVANEAYDAFQDLIRGAVEALAYADRTISKSELARQRDQEIQEIKDRSAEAIREVNADKTIPAAAKRRIIETITEVAQRAERQDRDAREREQRLETMSLLGVVAGFMTHEFGVAIDELHAARSTIARLTSDHPELEDDVNRVDRNIEQLREYVRYTTAYVQGAREYPVHPYKARPRIKQTARIFGGFAADRDIVVIINVPSDLPGPFVPISLYSGIALNLLTNALKAITASAEGTEHTVAFTAWNEKSWHILEVSDTGVGIPEILWDRVFEPLYSTTDQAPGPLGTGMGLGLALVRRAAEAFGGKATVVKPTYGYRTTVRVELPTGLSRERRRSERTENGRAD